MSDLLTKEDCIRLLLKKHTELGRLPKKSDCTIEEVARIKAYFGPWPRALEAAGVKPISDKSSGTMGISRTQRNEEFE